MDGGPTAAPLADAREKQPRQKRGERAGLPLTLRRRKRKRRKRKMTTMMRGRQRR
jgi:hypothetical protein